jgi:hypothetical protein
MSATQIIETDALIVARKIEMSAIIARRGLATSAEPANEGNDGAVLRICWEGKVFQVTVQDLGPDLRPDDED